MIPEIKRLARRMLRVTLVAILPLTLGAGLIWDGLAAGALLLGAVLAGAGFLGSVVINSRALAQGDSVIPPIAVHLGKVILTALAAWLLVRTRVNLGLFFFAGYAVILFGTALEEMRQPGDRV